MHGHLNVKCDSSIQVEMLVIQYCAAERCCVLI